LETLLLPTGGSAPWFPLWQCKGIRLPIRFLREGWGCSPVHAYHVWGPGFDPQNHKKKIFFQRHVQVPHFLVVCGGFLELEILVSVSCLWEFKIFTFSF
jgi:hypothetical protein